MTNPTTIIESLSQEPVDPADVQRWATNVGLDSDNWHRFEPLEHHEGTKTHPDAGSVFRHDGQAYALMDNLEGDNVWYPVEIAPGFTA